MKENSSDELEIFECVEINNKKPKMNIKNNEDRPLLKVMKCLTSNDNKQNLVLTNLELSEILQKEFKIDTRNLHELEIDIYMNVMKKFLKHWPRWDYFDKVIADTRKKQLQTSLDETLEQEYINLKEYLQGMLKRSQPLARESVRKAIEEKNKLMENRTDKKDIDNCNVELEIKCTRSQLNTLFLKHPHRNLNNTIFNIEGTEPSKIILNSHSIESILEWPEVNVHLNLLNLNYRRENSHKLQHRLINLRLMHDFYKNSKLDNDLQVKILHKTTIVQKAPVLKTLNNMISLCAPAPGTATRVAKAILEMARYDVEKLTTKFPIMNPCRYWANQYRYVRYLYTDNFLTETEDKYDLQLEETLEPIKQFYIGKVNVKAKLNLKELQLKDWFKVECLPCDKTFIGVDQVDNLIQHFDEVHNNEPSWQCANCSKAFTMTSLALKRWSHVC